MTREEAPREILFRGKRVDNGEWVHGFFWKDIWGDGESCYILFDGEDYPVVEGTRGQYTGLTDRNGVKIFVGDIVRISAPVYKWQTIEDISEVYFDNGCYCVNWGGNYRPHHRTRIDSFIPDATFEVIGNIHDNPELLEGGEGNG